MLPYSRQTIDADDIEAVVAVLKSDFLTMGPAVPAFEAALARRCGAREAVATTSATAALHLACLALGVGPGDVVWTSPITFLASANCALYCGATVDFVDIDPRSLTLCPRALERKLDAAARAGRLPKVVIPVHLAGASADMEAIGALCARHGVHVIEDAAHALGAERSGRPVGAGAHSAVTVFSFHPVKMITSGEGGAALTNDPALAAAMRRLRNHGVTRDPAEMESPPDGPWSYEQQSLGYNYRMSDLQAALGLSQLAKLDAFVAERRRQADLYDGLLKGQPLITPRRDPRSVSSFHLYIVQLKLEAISLSHRAVFEGMRAVGFGVQLHYIPVYRQPFYARQGFRREDFPAAEAYYACALSLPLFPGLPEAEQRRAADTLCALLAARPALSGAA
jgi:UDP-4-amino-4,6-dideoxy-N-acetyl-beta-L-altrosamine transaminase